LGINNERQDCKIGNAGVGYMWEEVNERDEGEGIWLVDFIYKIEQWNPLKLL
jgi:hypothetical protein